MSEYGWPECKSAMGLNLSFFGREKIPQATTGSARRTAECRKHLAESLAVEKESAPRKGCSNRRVCGSRCTTRSLHRYDETRNADRSPPRDNAMTLCSPEPKTIARPPAQ